MQKVCNIKLSDNWGAKFLEKNIIHVAAYYQGLIDPKYYTLCIYM